MGVAKCNTLLPLPSRGFWTVDRITVESTYLCKVAFSKKDPYPFAEGRSGTLGRV